MPLIRRDRVESRHDAADPIAGLADPDADLRWQAARAAADQPGIVAALVAALDRETDRRVCEAIVASLARTTGEQGVAALLQRVRSGSAGERTAALDALRENAGRLAALVPGLLEDADPDMRLLICEVVRELPAGQATRLMVELLDYEPLANVCCAAIEVLAEVGDASALPALTRCAGRFASEPFVAFSAGMAAKRIGGKA